MNMTNTTTTLAPATQDRDQAKREQSARAEAAKAFGELRFLDNAELTLIGGGGAHGGNTL